MNKKDNSILLRLSDEEARILNEGWFDYVNWKGRPASKTEYIRESIKIMRKYLNGEVIDLCQS